jgi:ATP phosphoribosyltransferase regulatory subunit
VAALFFGSARRRRRLEARLAGRLEAAGFAEVVLPILDYLEPYESLLTPASRGELYRFIDRDGELLALRADFTPLLARLLAPMLAPGLEPGRRPLELPQRLFYRGDVVRYEEERPGRQRELYQIGAELLGIAGAAAEDEMLRLFLDLLTAAAAVAAEAEAEDGAPAAPPGSGVRVVLGFAGALDRPLAQAAAAGADPGRLAAALVRRERWPVREEARTAAGDASWEAVLRAVLERGVPDDPGALGPAAAPRLAEVSSLRDDVARAYPQVEIALDLAEFAQQTLDPSLAPVAEAADAGGGSYAGSYYDGLVFRAYAGAVALPAGAGGRYDRLFRRLGAEVPAVGFSLGLDRLANGPRARAALVAAGSAIVPGGRP